MYRGLFHSFHSSVFAECLCMFVGEMMEYLIHLNSADSDAVFRNGFVVE